VPKDRGSEYLVLDIETIPDVSRWARPETEDGRATFPPTWAHRIIVIGCLWLDADYQLKRLGVVGKHDHQGDDAGERELLLDFSRWVGKARPVLVTYNGRSFDLPVIALRALCHGVPLPWYYREKGVRYRYSEEGHMDLCDWLADHGATRSGSLDAIARLIGLPGKVGVDGSQVEGLFRAGKLPAIQSYCLADVAQTALLFLRFRALQGGLAPDKFKARAAALLEALAADPRVADVAQTVDREHLLAVASAA
jgi:predicted PolB exonuclease-like 3'-5' exonuclease